MITEATRIAEGILRGSLLLRGQVRNILMSNKTAEMEGKEIITPANKNTHVNHRNTAKIIVATFTKNVVPFLRSASAMVFSLFWSDESFKAAPQLVQIFLELGFSNPQ